MTFRHIALIGLLSTTLLYAPNTFACSLNPTAVISAPTGPYLSDNTFTQWKSIGSTANCGSITSYQWKLGSTVLSSSATFNYTVTLGANQTESTFTLKLVITNTVGRKDSTSRTVTVRDYQGQYYVKDHLGSPRVTVDGKGNVLSYADYYPFGGIMPGRSGNNGMSHDRTKFTGYLLEEEGDQDTYHAEARGYDPVIGRFTSRDPLTTKYPSLSPYNYVANNPVNAFDPDGRLIVFINGIHGGSGAWPRSDRYWSSSGDFAHAVMNQLNDRNAIFIDGSMGGFSNTFAHATFLGGLGNVSPANRYNAGYVRGKRDAAKLIGLLSPDETLKIVTHSMGMVYGKGYVQAIMEYIRNSKDPKIRKVLISLVVDIDPFQAASAYGEAHPDIYTQQFWHNGGWFGMADEVQYGVDENNEDESQKSHALRTFLGDIRDIQEGLYVWDEKNQKFICLSCEDQ